MHTCIISSIMTITFILTQTGIGFALDKVQNLRKEATAEATGKGSTGELRLALLAENLYAAAVGNAVGKVAAVAAAPAAAAAGAEAATEFNVQKAVDSIEGYIKENFNNLRVRVLFEPQPAQNTENAIVAKVTVNAPELSPNSRSHVEIFIIRKNGKVAGYNIKAVDSRGLRAYFANIEMPSIDAFMRSPGVRLALKKLAVIPDLAASAPPEAPAPSAGAAGRPFTAQELDEFIRFVGATGQVPVALTGDNHGEGAVRMAASLSSKEREIAGRAERFLGALDGVHRQSYSEALRQMVGRTVSQQSDYDSGGSSLEQPVDHQAYYEDVVAGTGLKPVVSPAAAAGAPAVTITLSGGDTVDFVMSRFYGTDRYLLNMRIKFKEPAGSDVSAVRTLGGGINDATVDGIAKEIIAELQKRAFFPHIDLGSVTEDSARLTEALTNLKEAVDAAPNTPAETFVSIESQPPVPGSVKEWVERARALLGELEELLAAKKPGYTSRFLDMFNYAGNVHVYLEGLSSLVTMEVDLYSGLRRLETDDREVLKTVYPIFMRHGFELSLSNLSYIRSLEDAQVRRATISRRMPWGDLQPEVALGEKLDKWFRLAGIDTASRKQAAKSKPRFPVPSRGINVQTGTPGSNLLCFMTSEAGIITGSRLLKHAARQTFVGLLDDYLRRLPEVIEKGPGEGDRGLMYIIADWGCNPYNNDAVVDFLGKIRSEELSGSYLTSITDQWRRAHSLVQRLQGVLEQAADINVFVDAEIELRDNEEQAGLLATYIKSLTGTAPSAPAAAAGEANVALNAARAEYHQANQEWLSIAEGEQAKEIKSNAKILIVAPQANKFQIYGVLNRLGFRDVTHIRFAVSLEEARNEYPGFKPDLVVTADKLDVGIVDNIVQVYGILRNAIISLPGIGTENFNYQAVEDKINEWLVTQV